MADMAHTKGKKALQRTPRLGRPPAGSRGERVSDYTQLSLRLPERTRALLDAISGMTGAPSWRVIEQALEAYVQRLPEEERRLLQGVQQRRARDH
jgi:predicted DNA-binding protein